MIMKRRSKSGKCHICGKIGKLSYEHVPPASAFNKKATKVYKAIDVIQGGGLPWEVEGLSGTILQRGLGDYTLCIKCNSFTGAKYAKDFINACEQAMNSGRLEIRQDVNRARIGLLGINPVNFGKQILTMFASVNSSRFFDAQTQLRKLVLDERAYGINVDKYAIYMYLYRGGLSRQSGLSVSMRTDGTAVLSTELTTVPFGFVMVIDPQREKLPNYGTEITGILNDYEPDTVGDFLFEIPIFVQFSPMPLDFRKKEDILDHIQREEQ